MPGAGQQGPLPGAAQQGPPPGAGQQGDVWDPWHNRNPQLGNIVPQPAVPPYLPGDWRCICGYHCYARNGRCKKCGREPRDEDRVPFNEGQCTVCFRQMGPRFQGACTYCRGRVAQRREAAQQPAAGKAPPPIGALLPGPQRFGPPPTGHTGAADGLARPLVRWCRAMLHPCGVTQGLLDVGPPDQEDLPAPPMPQILYMPVGDVILPWYHVSGVVRAWSTGRAVTSRDVTAIILGATDRAGYVFFCWSIEDEPHDMGFSHMPTWLGLGPINSAGTLPDNSFVEELPLALDRRRRPYTLEQRSLFQWGIPSAPDSPNRDSLPVRRADGRANWLEQEAQAVRRPPWQGQAAGAQLALPGTGAPAPPPQPQQLPQGAPAASSGSGLSQAAPCPAQTPPPHVQPGQGKPIAAQPVPPQATSKSAQAHGPPPGAAGSLGHVGGAPPATPPRRKIDPQAAELDLGVDQVARMPGSSEAAKRMSAAYFLKYGRPDGPCGYGAPIATQDATSMPAAASPGAAQLAPSQPGATPAAVASCPSADIRTRGAGSAAGFPSDTSQPRRSFEMDWEAINEVAEEKRRLQEREQARRGLEGTPGHLPPGMEIYAETSQHVEHPGSDTFTSWIMDHQPGAEGLVWCRDIGVGTQDGEGAAPVLPAPHTPGAEETADVQEPGGGEGPPPQAKPMPRKAMPGRAQRGGESRKSPPPKCMPPPAEGLGGQPPFRQPPPELLANRREGGVSVVQPGAGAPTPCSAARPVPVPPDTPESWSSRMREMHLQPGQPTTQQAVPTLEGQQASPSGSSQQAQLPDVEPQPRPQQHQPGAGAGSMGEPGGDGQGEPMPSFDDMD